MRRVLFILAVLSGCRDETGPPDDGRPRSWPCLQMSLPPAPQVLLNVDEPAAVRVELPMRCELGVTATATVVDPSNQPIDIDGLQLEERWTFNPVEAVEHLSALVHFTPHTPGPHHVVVKFSPNVGTGQTDVRIISDRRNEAPLAQVSGATTLDDCAAIELTTDDRFLCLAPRVAVYSQTGALQQELATNGVAARHGRTLWIDGLDAGTLSRCDETAGSWACVDTGIRPLVRDALLVPEDDDVVLIPRLGVEARRVARHDGGFVSTDLSSLSSGQLAVGAGRDGSKVWCSAVGQQCFVDLDDGLPARCAFDGYDRVGIGSGFGGTWTLSRTTAPQHLQRLTFTQTQMFSFEQPITWMTPAQLVFGTAPWLELDSRRYVVAAEGSGLVFERIRRNGEVVSVTTSLITLRENGALLFYRR